MIRSKRALRETMLGKVEGSVGLGEVTGWSKREGSG